MSFKDRMDKIINQGLSVSKEVLDKAKTKSKNLADKGVLKYEIMQLEKAEGKKFLELGGKVYELLVRSNRNTISKSTPEIKELLMELKDLESRAEEKETELKKS
ncbi:MAG: hypothetical protein DRP57_11155 [Spirochaetes bacterium]|nr:MAG: hypothetical protein DRP57_11155 [Spirochaetota bacterium]